MMNRWMQHFLALAEEGHFGRAAARLGMAQPPLSQSIQRLERDLGVALFVRSRSGVRLTASGEAYLPDARAAVAAASRAAVRAHAAAKSTAPVRVGLVSIALWNPLRELLAVARSLEIEVELVEAATNDQLRQLAMGTLDLGFLVPPFEAPARLRVVEMGAAPVQAAVPAAWGCDAASVSIERLADRFISFPRDDGPVLYDAIMAMFARQGLTPAIAQVSPRMLTTLALVAAGIGGAIVPGAIAESLCVKGVDFRPIEPADGMPVWPLALAHMPLSARSPSARLLAGWQGRAQAEKPS